MTKQTNAKTGDGASINGDQYLDFCVVGMNLYVLYGCADGNIVYDPNIDIPVMEYSQCALQDFDKDGHTVKIITYILYCTYILYRTYY